MAARHTQIVFSNLEDIHPTREGGEPPLANNSLTCEDTLASLGGEPPQALFLFFQMKI